MSTLLPGFANPVADAQACFRAVLKAMSRPGHVLVAGRGLQPPPPLDPATGAVLLTLADAELPVWLATAFAPAAEWIVFHSGAPLRQAKDGACFVVTPELPDLAALPCGTDDDPEESATVILQVDGLRSGRRLRFTGPGLATPMEVAVKGLPAHFAAAWAANHALYPRGVDLILCAGSSIMALPRSLQVEEIG
jgi:alpha-D-ribose 1-methylphosphonate 5-triphosphate synthase subunit PhnH